MTQSNSDEFSKPVMLCKCGKVLETPSDYAKHCEQFPDHFTKTDPAPVAADSEELREILAQECERGFDTVYGSFESRAARLRRGDHDFLVSSSAALAAMSHLRTQEGVNAGLLAAAKRLAIVEVHRLAYGGGTLLWGYRCQLCDAEHEGSDFTLKDRTDFHKPDCAIATAERASGKVDNG